MAWFYAKHQHESSDQAFDFITTNVLLGKYWPTKNAIDKPMRLVGDKLAPAVLEKGWNQFAVPARLQLPYPKLSSGFELLEQPSKFADATNRIRPLKEFRDGVAYCESEVTKDLGEFGQWFKKNQSKLDEPTVSKEFGERVRTLTRKHEPLVTVLDPHCEPKLLVKEKQDVFQLIADIDPKVAPASLVAVSDRKLVEVQKGIDLNGEALAQDIGQYAEGLAGLSLCGENGIHMAPTYLINCGDVNEVLALHRAQLIAMLNGIRTAHHIDLGLMNRVTGGTENLKKLGNEMDKKMRGCVWATLGGVASEEHAIKVAESNPVLATEGAGNVFTFVGIARHRGFPAVVSAAVLGKRIELDQRYNDDEAGPMTSAFGPQSNKNLVGIDDLDTFDWTIETMKMLAKESGLNVVTRHSNGVISPYLGRTLSSLEPYRFIDGVRLANMLTGFVMAYLDVSAPSRANISRVQRALCDRAEAKFFGPFKDRPGFTAALKPLDTSRGTRFDLAFEIQSPDPIEEIVVTRRHISKK